MADVGRAAAPETGAVPVSALFRARYPELVRLADLLSDGQQFSSRTIPGWPGSGVVLWGPLTLPAQIAMPGDIIVITYDATGHVLREVPLIFLG